MKSTNIRKIAAIFFFIGFILILISWLFSYPIHILDINQVTFNQFFPLLWPGIVFCLSALFLLMYYSKSKIIMAFCCSLFPLFLNIPAFFFSYIPSSDCGAARGMFQVFQKTGIDPEVIPYFEFPSYFSLNKIIHQTIGLNDKGIALISFTLYGVLLGLFLYLFFLKLNKKKYIKLIPFLLVIIYFIGVYSFINYQWVPQTLALVFFFLLIIISTYLLFNSPKIQWRFMLIIIFISLTLTHAFIPAIFLFFFGILTFKKRYLLQIFLAILSIYLIVNIYHATTHFHLYIETFRQSILERGGEYVTSLSISFREPGDILSQFISYSNRLIVPMVWIIGVIGTAVLFLKRKIDFSLTALGLSAGIYLTVGMFYPIFGLRAAQILLIPITLGFMYFISKWRKPAIAFLFVILILAVSEPMRMAYDNTHFQTDEEANACNFLANNIIKTFPNVAVGQVNYGYFTNKFMYLKKTDPIAIRPGTPGFTNIFNESMSQNEYILYNSNLGKEILSYIMTKEQFNNKLKEIMDNNKIYDCNNLYVIKGVNNE